MWLILAFCSAMLLGFYDVSRKTALKGNMVMPVLLLNALFSTLLFLPFILLSAYTHVLDGSLFAVASGDWSVHKYILLKSLIVSGIYLFGYLATQNLPLTIYGPVNATRPVITLLGALTLFGERLNGWQWTGIIIAGFSLIMLGRSGKKEGINFAHNRWILCLAIATLLGGISGLYDKYLMASPDDGGIGLDRMMVQSWSNIYLLLIMMVATAVHILFSQHRQAHISFHWHWSIPCIALFLCAADFIYLLALSMPDALISVVSMVRRASVIVTFAFGAMLFHEKNLKSKVVDLCLVIIGMVCIMIGSF